MGATRCHFGRRTIWSSGMNKKFREFLEESHMEAKTGDHVAYHQDIPLKSGKSEQHIYHGHVTKSGKTSFHVEWGNGSKTRHSQSNGKSFTAGPMRHAIPSRVPGKSGTDGHEYAKMAHGATHHWLDSLPKKD
jgi:hypothetical protein